MGNPFFPNVPNVPGVPAVNRIGLAAAPLAILAQDVAGILSLFAPPAWGIFDKNGNPVLVGDTCVAFDFLNESRILDYQIEGGAFYSYNKVQTPYDARIEISQAGDIQDRQTFLQAATATLRSLDTFQVITPEIIYPVVNVIHTDYRQTARAGATMITMGVWVREIRIAPAPNFSSTKAPSGASTVNDGQVQPTPATDNLVNHVVF